MRALRAGRHPRAAVMLSVQHGTGGACRLIREGTPRARPWSEGVEVVRVYFVHRLSLIGLKAHEPRAGLPAGVRKSLSPKVRATVKRPYLSSDTRQPDPHGVSVFRNVLGIPWPLGYLRLAASRIEFLSAPRLVWA